MNQYTTSEIAELTSIPRREVDYYRTYYGMVPSIRLSHRQGDPSLWDEEDLLKIRTVKVMRKCGLHSSAIVAFINGDLKWKVRPGGMPGHWGVKIWLGHGACLDLLVPKHS